MKKVLSKKLKKSLVVVASGGFDPIHIGHVRMFNEAKKLGNKLVVIINNDNWLKKKKGFVFMPEKQRKEIIEGFRAVDEVKLSSHKKNPLDMSVTNDLKKIKPDIFVQGGDRNPSKLPVPGSELAYCEETGCKVVYNVGRGGKVQSSTWLSTNFINDVLERNFCPCGSKKSFVKCGLKRTREHQKNLQKMLNKI